MVKQRKLKFAATKEGEEKKEKVLTEADKLNRDYQALEKYMAKKENPDQENDQEDDDNPNER
jgi:hypothetical protein